MGGARPAGKAEDHLHHGGPEGGDVPGESLRDAAADRVNQAIEQFHLAYVKLDLTTIFNAYGEAPGCWAKGHYHGDWAESLNMIYEGITYVTAKSTRSIRTFFSI